MKAWINFLFDVTFSADVTFSIDVIRLKLWVRRSQPNGLNPFFWFVCGNMSLAFYNGPYSHQSSYQVVITHNTDILNFTFHLLSFCTDNFFSPFFAEYKCYKQLEKMKSHFEANPMWEFLHGEHIEAREYELNSTFRTFQKKHKKSYTNSVETRKRKDIFRHNQR